MTPTELEAIGDAVDYMKELKQRMVDEGWHSHGRLSYLAETIAVLKATIAKEGKASQ